MIVLDSSIVLADVFKEPGRISLAEIYDEAAISSIILAEIAAKLVERSFAADEFEFVMDYMRPICRPLTALQAIQAGRWRAQTRHLGLSLGDRCCLALALELDAEAYTADRVWAKLDLGVKIRVIR